MFEHAIAVLEKCQRELEQFRRGAWLRTEPQMLPAWKRRPHSFHTLPSGEVVVYGRPGRVQTVQTQYLRPNHTIATVSLLQTIRWAQAQEIKFHDAEVWLISRRNGRVIQGKRIEAVPDPACPEWRERPERRMTAEDLIREQFTGKGLERELRRIK